MFKRHLKLVERLEESNRMMSEGTLNSDYFHDAWDTDNEGEKVMMDLIANHFVLQNKNLKKN